MELSEAKERLTYINQAYDYGNIYSRDDLEAIDTLLKALDNSISKDEVRKLLDRENKKYNEAVNDVYKNPANALVDFQRVCGKIDILKELLGKE